jgi:hypothetical protein
VPPLVLALIDAVFALAYHHDERARRGLSFDHESIRVRAALQGPEHDHGLEFRVTICLVPRSEEREVSEEQVRFHVDLREERLRASELAIPELPLDRTGFASLVGALEAWCYERIPLDREG